MTRLEAAQKIAEKLTTEGYRAEAKQGRYGPIVTLWSPDGSGTIEVLESVKRTDRKGLKSVRGVGGHISRLLWATFEGQDLDFT